MEHRPKYYSVCIVNATESNRENREPRRATRVASAVRAALFKRASVIGSGRSRTDAINSTDCSSRLLKKGISMPETARFRPQSNEESTTCVH